MTGDPGRRGAVTIHLVRHGAARGVAGRCIGHSDLELGVDGRADMERLAATWSRARSTRLISSDLRRAGQSAAALARAWGGGIEVETDARLREMHFGDWDGRSWAEIERDHPVALARWMERWEEAATPGGEAFGDVIRRTSDWLADTLLRASDDGRSELVVVAHAGSIRALLVHTLGVPRRVAFRLRLDHARLSTVRIHPGVATDDLTGAACDTAELLLLNADRVPGGD